jgi:signal peptidase II
MFRVVVLLLTLTACVGCDQLSKSAARSSLPRATVVSLMGDIVRLQYAENPGAFLSLGAALPKPARRAVFTFGIAAVIISVFAVAIFVPGLGTLQRIALACICAGGLGNLIDRVGQDGYVTDFLNVGIGPVRTGIFNVADLILMLGVAAVLVIRPRKRPDEARAVDEKRVYRRP